MLRCGWLLFFACLASGLVFSAPVYGAEPTVNDRAEFFSKSAVEQAKRKVQEIRNRFKVEVVIETFASIPDNMKVQYKTADKKAFFRRWAESARPTKA